MILAAHLAVLGSSLMNAIAVGAVGGVGAFLVRWEGGLGALGATCPVVLGGVLTGTPCAAWLGFAALGSVPQRLALVALSERGPDWGNLYRAPSAKKPHPPLLEQAGADLGVVVSESDAHRAEEEVFVLQLLRSACVAGLANQLQTREDARVGELQLELFGREGRALALPHRHHREAQRGTGSDAGGGEGKRHT